MHYIKVTRKGHVGCITMDNEAKRNALSHHLTEEMIGALDYFTQAGDVWCVIIKANPGVKVWCAGHDISELPVGKDDPLPYNNPFEKLLRAVQDYPYPVVMAAEGSIWGGACDLACVCDIVIGGENVSFTMTPARLGIPYNPSGLNHFLTLMGVHMTKQMFFTAAPLNAQDSLNCGLVNYLVPTEEVEESAWALAEHISSNAPLALKAIKDQFRLLSKGAVLDAETFEKLNACRHMVYNSNDYAEGVAAFKEKRRPMFTGK